MSGFHGCLVVIAHFHFRRNKNPLLGTRQQARSSVAASLSKKCLCGHSLFLPWTQDKDPLVYGTPLGCTGPRPRLDITAPTVSVSIGSEFVVRAHFDIDPSDV